ncbi:hypothetical protein BN1058_02183 [Paraliobacillus sp. PM-2]|uniref:FbpB family small basic protein n=1 Tax=Paraliobacillus sp. PM-2 TaxID=1462524 RepID=UPI00061CB3D7|nr:FbpB family small basic protein [Paraliobacillus sp. PM-2]CQR47852.1 hypothetical protein BN1058_02183 [Paraliobacillus sp. PM-2]
MRNRKPTFEQLVNQNKQELLNDKNAMKRLEETLDQKYSTRKERMKTKHIN